MVENIARFLREGHSRIEAAILATRQIFQAIVGCTATIMFAFLPLMMIGGNSGKFIRVLPTAVLATVGASLLVALTIIPFLASRFLKEREDPHGNRLLQWITGAIHRFYQPLLHRALARPKLTVWGSLAACVVVMVGVGGLIGFSLFPKADTPHFLITVETPDGSSLAETDRALRFVEGKLRELPDLQSYFSNLGHGNPKIYYNETGNEGDSSYGDVFVKLAKYDTTDTPRALDQLRRELEQYPNAHIHVREFRTARRSPRRLPCASSVRSSIELYELAGKVEKIIEETPGARDVENPVRMRRTNLQPRRSIRTRRRCSACRPSSSIAPCVSRSRAFRRDASRIPTASSTTSWCARRSTRGPTCARSTRCASRRSTARRLPLSQLARVEFSSAPTEIHRFNRERAVTINADVKSGYNTDRVTKAVLERLDQMQWPRGYSYVPGGELETRTESFGGLQSALIVALLGIVAILVLEFGNFKSTLIVLTVVPFGIAGGILLLGLTGNTISFTATIGFIALIGIETKNSILLVDFTNRLRAEGVPLDEAIERAGEVRFLPILLTSATAIGGLLAAGAAELGHVLTARVGDHRWTALLHVHRPHRHAGDLQAHPADDRSDGVRAPRSTSTSRRAHA